MIKQLTLYFEDGIEGTLADKIAQKAQNISDQYCVGGGYKPIDMDFGEFDEEIMEYGYKKTIKSSDETV